ELVLASVQVTEIEEQLLEAVAVAALQGHRPLGVVTLEERCAGELSGALQRRAPLGEGLRGARLLERALELPDVAGQGVRRVQPVELRLAQDGRRRGRGGKHAADVGQGGVEVATPGGGLAAGPEEVDQLLAARAARVEREVDEHLERALCPPRRARQRLAVDEQARRAEERQAERAAPSLRRAPPPAPHPPPHAGHPHPHPPPHPPPPP